MAACVVRAAAILLTDCGTVDWSFHARRVAIAPSMIYVRWHGSAGVAWCASWPKAVSWSGPVQLSAARVLVLLVPQTTADQETVLLAYQSSGRLQSVPDACRSENAADGAQPLHCQATCLPHVLLLQGVEHSVCLVPAWSQAGFMIMV